MTQSEAMRHLRELRDQYQIGAAFQAGHSPERANDLLACVEALTVALHALEIKAPARRGEIPLWARFLSCAILGAAVAACVIYAAG
mgnify:CR=1 FL=1